MARSSDPPRPDSRTSPPGPGELSSEATTRTGPNLSALSEAALPPVDGAGSVFGPYRTSRVLGRGGMGVVYEAEEIESGRRVALKVMAGRLEDAHARERFEREGRLAASVNHPHCVFVFSAAEIGDHPVIAMELMQGTLADRLKREGPLAPAIAVDVMLQVIHGLQAAAGMGILHRDIKPSNCFVDADGVVKIGDFGISRSLRPTEETAFSTRTRFAATPEYASPEQLRGSALDARADIYSLGASLYELVTGRRPFTGVDLISLLMAVANEPPRPPHVLAPGVPKGLSDAILRCLAKQPDRRFADYAALAAALEPYSSKAASPATFGRRCLAGAIDHVLLLPPNALLTLQVSGVMAAMDRDAWQRHQISWYVLLLLYFGITESLWAATPGKALLGLTLVDTNGRPPRVAKVVARAALYATLWALGSFLLVAFWSFDARTLAVGPTGGAVLLLWGLPWSSVIAMFSTVRRRNGYAGLHDLATGTRVVERTIDASVGRTATSPVATTVTHESVEQLGPFTVIAGTLAGMPAGWRPGIDERLRRDVWIRQVAPGGPPIDHARIAISRPTRLRWLAGRRAPHQAWDVFEAVPGVRLEQACLRPRAWGDARWWLLDLARECTAQTPGDHPPLRADRVWVLDSGGAKLVDDPSADDVGGVSTSRVSCASLLHDVVRAARGSSAPPWPLGAHRFLERLAAEPPLEDAAIVGALESLSGQRAALTRRWRALLLMSVALLPVVFSGYAVLMARYLTGYIQHIPADVLIAVECLGQLRRADRGRVALSPADREMIETALASRYRSVLTDRRLFGREYLYLGLSSTEIIERVLRRTPTAEEGRRASTHPTVLALVKEATTISVPSWPAMGITVLGGCFLFVALLALAAAAALRGGLMRVVGLELVTSNGQAASRRHVLARTALTWAPLLLVTAVGITRGAFPIKPSSPVDLVVAMGAALLLIFAGAVVTLIHPARGIQDRLAGTWVVPR
jgi:uncharacterized RDD family membrane protein YckC